VIHIGPAGSGMLVAWAVSASISSFIAYPGPTISVVIGEGGSGGALALGVCDRVYMMENSVYSVISPEGCAAILWGDRSRAEEAADALRPTASDLWELGIVDGLILPNGQQAAA